MVNQSAKTGAPGPTSLWRQIAAFVFDLRFLQAVGQIIFVFVLVAIVSRIFTDMMLALQAQNLTPDYAFFQNRAGFRIGEAPDWYTADNSYWDAFLVGLTNTLRVISAGLVGATLLGILVGVFLLSRNWLLRTISRVYVELLRNTPLLVQLFVWYFIGILALPIMNDAIALPQEGVWLIPLRLAVYLIALFFILRSYPRGGSRRPVMLLGLAAFVAVMEYAFATFYYVPLDAAPANVSVGVNSAQGIWSLHGAGAFFYAPFQLYAIVSTALIVLAAITPVLLRRFYNGNEDGELKLLGLEYNQVRNMLLGLTVGQFLAGLLFYFGVMPAQSLRTEVYPLIFLSNRGFVFPELAATPRLPAWLAFVTMGVLAAGIMWFYYGRLMETSGEQYPRVRLAALAIIGFALVGWVLVSVGPLPEQIAIEGEDGTVVFVNLADAQEQELLTREQSLLYSRSPFVFARPERGGLRFATGIQLSPEYIALFLGLTIYTSAFIAEIVRAGIQAVPHGQIEAARALGLTQSQVLRMIVLPQALRVIVPPMGNQFLNLAKNSSLAIAIGYADFYATATTIMNQSGQSVTGMTVVMGIYLVMSLSISASANWVNRRFQLVTR